MTIAIEHYRELDTFSERTEDEDARWEMWESLHSGWQAFDADDEGDAQV